MFCGLGGWAEGFLAEGYDVIGFDIEARPYPGQLVLQDVLTLDGRQFRNAAVIVASPPCQEFSYMAMPWKRAKQKARYIRDRQTEWSRLTALFWACWRIAREAGVPMVLENVKGAQPWVGPARAHFGSFYLWGDINSVGSSIVAGNLQFGNVLRPGKRGTGGKQNPDGTENGQGSWFKIADSKNRGSKNNGGSWFNEAHNTESGHGQNPDGRKQEGSGAAWFDKALDERRKGATKNGGDWFGSAENCSEPRRHGSKSSKRAQASAEIAKIPFALAQHIAGVFKPSGLVSG